MVSSQCGCVLRSQVQLSGSPIYVVEQRLGKGGFGQVCRGTRLVPRKVALPNKPNSVRCTPRRALARVTPLPLWQRVPGASWAWAKRTRAAFQKQA